MVRGVRHGWSRCSATTAPARTRSCAPSRRPPRSAWSGITDLEFNAGPDEWITRWEAGGGLLRVRAATYADGLDAVIEQGLRTGDVLPGCDDRARMGPLKIISDGSLNTRTAWCCEPYAGPSPLGFPHGQPNQTPEELRDLLRRATDHGLDVAVHAIGDRAVGEALDAIAETGARGSIEHAQLVRRDDVRRMAELGVVASVQPAHLVDDRDVSDRLWPGRGDRSFAFRWMLDDGVRLALGSDAPVARLDPWLAVTAAVHRTVDGREPWYADQAITLREALAASTDGLGHGRGRPPRRPGAARRRPARRLVGTPRAAHGRGRHVGRRTSRCH